MTHLKPSHFTSYPWDSILQKSEAETIARNIMVIRKRRGDVWPLSYAAYGLERLADGASQPAIAGELTHFNQVIKMIPDAIGAISFSRAWAEAARKVTP